MPYEVHFEDKGAYAKFTGKCSYQEILQATIQIWENPKFEYMHYEIFDYLDVPELTVSKEDAMEMAVRDSVASRSTRREKIVVLATDKSLLEIAERYKETLKGTDIGFFIADSLQTARAWLDSDIA